MSTSLAYSMPFTDIGNQYALGCVIVFDSRTFTVASIETRQFVAYTPHSESSCLKLKSGLSNNMISTIFHISKLTVCRAIAFVRQSLFTLFFPQNVI